MGFQVLRRKESADMRLWIPFLLLFAGCKAQVIDVAVGQLFTVRLEGSDSIPSDGLPGWMSFDPSQSTLYGVPKWNRLENVTLRTSQGKSIDVNTYIELDQCKETESYIFLELYQDKPYENYKIEDLRELIKNYAERFDLEETQVRAYRADEITRYRKVQEYLINLGTDYIQRENLLVLWANIYCGTSEQAAEEQPEIMEKATLIESEGDHVQLGQARVKKDDLLALQTATPAPIARTTRMAKDNPPTRYNNIDKFECQRGKLCQKWLSPNTFIDSEDGYLPNLRSKVVSDDDSTNFLTVVHDKDRVALEGVPLSTGIFSFRLEVRDSADQMAAAAFNVEVKDEPEPNHAFELLLDTRYKKFKDEPKLLVKFGEKLVERIGGTREQVMINSVEEQGSNTVIRWSNSSLSRTTCEEKVVNATKVKMTGRGKSGIREFVKHMGADFAVRDVTIKLQGNCGPQTVTPQIIRVRASTIATPLDEEVGISNLVLLILIVVAIALLLVILFVVFCCIKRKQTPKKSQEYTTKGTPIVFPDDVRPDDDTNGSTAAVTTPMLVSHEHPPLNPNTTTLHENPIYKPPSEVGTPTRSAIGQRLPPPYVAS
uniref:Peptidase S72 domain-containing protein n=1 Tax=Bursaphelenchus xylophilus TaxID=6326 RepID=A0A1I7S2X6_BURXY